MKFRQKYLWWKQGTRSAVFHVHVYVLVAFSRYLNMAHGIVMAHDHLVHCACATTILIMSSMCSTLFILSMTFERFYSIIRPHKAASFNTVKRAKITILIIIIFSVLYNIPHAFITGSSGTNCNAYGKARGKSLGELYYWLSFILNFALPFVLLLMMNSFIIHLLRRRSSKFTSQTSSKEGQGKNQSQSSKNRTSERQIYITLLSVTFSFLIFTTPPYVLMFYIMFIDYKQSAYSFAAFYLFYQVGQKSYYTNYGINFFLYVTSGRKFRTDLMALIRCSKKKDNGGHSQNSSSGLTENSRI